ncbi:MAG: LIC12162 family protein [Candidatus Omnitrophota bacterium]
MKTVTAARKYLATTALSEIWDKSADIVLLAPWCVNNGYKHGPGKRIIPPSDINYSTVNLLENAKYCESAYDVILNGLTEALNEVHAVNKNADYWSVVLNSWLIYYINAAHERYKRVQKTLNEHSGAIYTHVVDLDDSFAPTSTFDFMANKITDDYFNLQLISQIVLFEGIDNERIDFKKEKAKRLSRSNHIAVDRFKTHVKRATLELRKLFFGYGEIAMVDMYHMSLVDLFSLELRLKSVISMNTFFPFWGDEQYPYDEKLRSKLRLKNSRADDPFIVLLKKLLPYSVPRYCLEGYASIRERAIAIKRPVPKIIISAVGWYLNDVFKIYAAEMKERGAKLAGVQHGGDHGSCLYQPTALFELRNKDLFFSWGWDDTEYPCKIIPAPSPHLSKIKDKALSLKGKEEDLAVFIAANFSRYPHRIGSNPGPEEINSYFQNQALFLENISPALSDKFYYRPLKEDFGRNIKEFIASRAPFIKWAQDKKAVDWIRKAKVVIVDYPVTTFVEALAMNVPLISYIDFNSWRIKNKAKAYFDMLEKAGVLYQDPKSAALKLNEIYDKAGQWWQGADIQKARRAFLDKYGQADEKWADIWAEKLFSISKA